MLAKTQGSAGGELDLVLKPARVDLPPQRFNDIAGPTRRTARHALRLLLVTHKDVKTEWLHGPGLRFESIR
jgi:hypothetical protein